MGPGPAAGTEPLALTAFPHGLPAFPGPSASLPQQGVFGLLSWSKHGEQKASGALSIVSLGVRQAWI